MVPERVADLKTVVTEACTNVVQHAYETDDGPLEVIVAQEAKSVTVIVVDSGSGIRPHADLERPTLRLGLTLIAALASSFEISGGSEPGTKIKLTVPLAAEVGDASETAPVARAAEGAKVSVEAPELVGPVMGRIFGAVAARQDMSIERVSDGMLLTEAISSATPSVFAGRHFQLVVTDRSGEVSLKIGPMIAGAGDEIRGRLRLPEEGGTLESLADEVEILSEPDGDYVTVRFLARHPER